MANIYHQAVGSVIDCEAVTLFGFSCWKTPDSRTTGEVTLSSAVVAAAEEEEEVVVVEEAAEQIIGTREDIWVDTCPESAVDVSPVRARDRRRPSSLPFRRADFLCSTHLP